MSSQRSVDFMVFFYKACLQVLQSKIKLVVGISSIFLCSDQDHCAEAKCALWWDARTLIYMYSFSGISFSRIPLLA